MKESDHWGFCFPKALRILRRWQYKEVLNQSKTLYGQTLILSFYFKNSPSSSIPRPKLGLIVSRKYGKAHERNRFKRCTREAFRLLAPSLPPHLWLVVRPKVPHPPLTTERIKLDLEHLLSIVDQHKIAVFDPREKLQPASVES